MASVHHVASYKHKPSFSGKLTDVDMSYPFPKQGIWCLKLNDELLLRGFTNWKDGMGNLVGTINRLRRGDVPGASDEWVKNFFNHHIRPVLEVSEIQLNFHPSDIPKACAEFWKINCVFSYEKIDTRLEKWWKYLREDGPFEDVAEYMEQRKIPYQYHHHLMHCKDFYDYEE